MIRLLPILGAICLPPLMRSAGRCLPDIAKVLLDAGANPNATADDGGTAMLEAAAVGCTDVMKLLIGKGVDVNFRDQRGLTALSVAATNKRYAARKLLVGAGAKQ